MKPKMPPNAVVFSGGMAEIKITNRQCLCLLDIEDYCKVSSHRWRANMNRNVLYAQTPIYIGGKRTLVGIHRIITNAKKGEQVDHINHDGLDNRKCNLRICRNGENGMNRRKQKSKTSSAYKGVCWDKNKGKWCCHIQVKGRLKYLGVFFCEKEAAKMYNIAAKKYYGEFACLNDV